MDAVTQVITTYVSGIEPFSVAIDGGGNLFIADVGANQILRVDAVTQVKTAVAGSGAKGFWGDGGPASSAGIDEPWDVTVDNFGNILFVDLNNRRIRRVDAATHIITTVVGNGTINFSGDGGSASSAGLLPTGIAVDSSGNLFVADGGNSRVRRVDNATQVIATVAGNGTLSFSGDDGPAASAELEFPLGAAVDSRGNLFIADTYNNRIRRVDAASGKIGTVAGNGYRDFSNPLYGYGGYSGDGGPGTSATLNLPWSVAVDGTGNLFIADILNDRVRRVDAATQVITTVAGGLDCGPSCSFSGDGAAATGATLHRPQGVAIDDAGNLFIADTFNARIRRVDAVTQVITTVAGSRAACSQFGDFSGDGGPSTSAVLNCPSGVAVDSAGNLFIADTGNVRIRRVDAATGVITTIAGSCPNPSKGCGGYSGDGGPATSAQLEPISVAVDRAGNLFIAETGNVRIRRVDATTQVITTVAGNGHRDPVSQVGGYTGDGGPATSAELDDPSGVAIDAAGNLFIADSGNNRIREVVASQDTTPPVTTATASPGPNSNGWNHTNVTATLNSTENEQGGTGVKQIQYTLSGAQSVDTQTVPASTASVSISAEGMTTLNYFGTDNAGNAEQSKAFTVQIDKTPPVVSGMPASGCTLWPPNSQMISVGTITAADVLSGVAPGSFQLTGSSNEPSAPNNPDVVITPNGSGGYAVQLRAARMGSGTGRIYTLNATATDLAGNTVTSTTTCSVPRDRSTAVAH